MSFGANGVPRELPPFAVVELLQAKLAASPSTFLDIRYSSLTFKRIAELVRYGRLGCEFTPDDSGNQLEIHVAIGKAESEYGGFIISEDYGKLILAEAVAMFKEDNFLGAGLLEFNRGAYHDIDSSPLVFQILTRTCLILLDPQCDAADEAKLETLYIERVINLINKTLKYTSY